MKRLVKDRNLGWKVESAGTGEFGIGKNPDRHSVRTARRHGINISKQVGRQFSVSDFDTFDLIFAMDMNNRREMLRLARNDADAAKVKLLLNDRVVPDPRGEKKLFEPVFVLILEGCKEIIKLHKPALVYIPQIARLSVWAFLKSYFQKHLKAHTSEYRTKSGTELPQG